MPKKKLPRWNREPNAKQLARRSQASALKAVECLDALVGAIRETRDALDMHHIGKYDPDTAVILTRLFRVIEESP